MLNFIEKAYAQVSTLPSLTPISGDRTPGDILLAVINLIIWIAGIMILIYLVYSGILYATAGGDEEKAAAGKKGLINGIIGLTIVIVSWAILFWLQNFFTSGVGGID